MKKRSKQYKAVFRTKIDFKQIESHQKPLLPGHSYYLEGGSNERVSYTELYFLQFSNALLLSVEPDYPPHLYS